MLWVHRASVLPIHVMEKEKPEVGDIKYDLKNETQGTEAVRFKPPPPAVSSARGLNPIKPCINPDTHLAPFKDRPEILPHMQNR